MAEYTDWEFLESLNMRIQFIFVQIFIKLFQFAQGLIWVPFQVLCLILSKFMRIPVCISQGKFYHRIIDFILVIFIALPTALYHLIFTIIVSALYEHRTKNILKVTEVYQEEFLYLHEKCDKSFEEKEEDDQQLDLYHYKSLLGRKLNEEYNSSNLMLSETTFMILIAVLKESGTEAKALGLSYLPTAYVTRKLRKYMFIDFTLSSLIYHTSNQEWRIDETQDFQNLVDLLVDRSLGSLNIIWQEGLPNYTFRNNDYLILRASLIINNLEREKFWTQ